MLPLIGKRFDKLLYKPIIGLSCLLRYWEDIKVWTTTNEPISVNWEKILNSIHFHSE